MRSPLRLEFSRIVSRALFEVRRLFWPRYESFADPEKFDQGIAGLHRKYSI